MIFLRADLSQAEARIVNVLSHNDELIAIARKKPWEFDSHRYLASIIFGKPENEITKEERQASKKICHGSNYSMQPERMSDSLLKDGFIYTPDECATKQRNYLQRFPAIQDGYQYRCRMKYIQNKALSNSWGRTIYFTYERMGPELFRRLYAFTPQSEIGDLLNQKGFIVAHQFIEKYNLKSRINLQVHDELAISCDVAEGWDLLRLLHESLEEEREYEGIKLSIPVEMALETRYHQGDAEFKRQPSYDEYLEIANKVWENQIK